MQNSYHQRVNALLDKFNKLLHDNDLSNLQSIPTMENGILDQITFEYFMEYERKTTLFNFVTYSFNESL
jgi:hypothetical protein